MLKTRDKLKGIGDYILVETPLCPTDIAIVFGTPHSCDIFTDHIVDLWKNGFFKRCILTGGALVRGTSVSESAYLKSLLTDRGVDPSCLITEGRSTNTGQNVEFSLPIIKDLNDQGYLSKSLLSVGKIFAARRCMMTVERWLPGTQHSFSAINTFGVLRERWMESPELVKKVIGENQKIQEYLRMGFLAEINLRANA